jgi:hypothetical protein
MILRKGLAIGVAHRATATAEPIVAREGQRFRRLAPLFSENFLYVADFLLDFAGDLFVGAAIAEVGVANGFSALFFNFAFGFPNAAFDFVFRAGSHEDESLRPTFPGALFGRSSGGRVVNWKGFGGHRPPLQRDSRRSTDEMSNGSSGGDTRRYNFLHYGARA